jgi:putative MATE family efflux protein
MTFTKHINKFVSIFKQSLSSEHMDFTTGSIRRAIILLAIPMVFEMIMESVFAVVDIFFVSRINTPTLTSADAVSIVGLTESMLTIVYSLAIGLSMAATAVVARRIGEKNNNEAGKAGAQAILIGTIVSVAIGIAGLISAPSLLRIMGATAHQIEQGVTYTRIALGGNIVIFMLFLINGIFRGAGNALIAMKSLWFANICNCILCPLFIHYFNWGITGAALATLTGRSMGVLYQLYHLFKGKGAVQLSGSQFVPNMPIIKNIVNIASTGAFQFIIASGSWIFMVRLITSQGENAVAAYTTAIRLIIFFIMPAWGLSNAAATLVGQNLGAKQPARAEQSVWTTAKYSSIFMISVTIFFWLFAKPLVGFISKDAGVAEIATKALRIMSLGYIFYGVGMVLTNAFNGAGDTRTPTWINIVCFWLFQIPLAYILTKTFKLGTTGVFAAIVISESSITILSYFMFKRGKWKEIKV